MCPFYIVASSAQQTGEPVANDNSNCDVDDEIWRTTSGGGTWMTSDGGTAVQNSRIPWEHGDGQRQWRVVASVQNWHRMTHRLQTAEQQRIALLGRQRRGKSPPRYGQFEEFSNGNSSANRSPTGWWPFFWGNPIGKRNLYSLPSFFLQRHSKWRLFRIILLNKI
jgi:hypothetical protein